MMINKRLIGTVAESKKYIAGNVILQWCSLAANIALMLSISRMLAELFRGSASVQLLTVTGIVVLLALAIRFFCSIGAAKMGYFSSKAVKKTLREKIYQKLLRLGNSYNEQVKTSEVVQVAVEGVDQLETYFGAYLPQFFYAMLAPLTLFIVLCFVNVPAAVVLLICVPLIPVAIAAVQTWAKKLLSKYWGQYTELGDTFLENLQGLTTLKIYQADEFKQQEMNEQAEKFRKITMKVLTMQLNSITIMDLIAYGGAALGVIMAVTQYQSGGVSLEGCLLIILLAADFFIPMRQLGRILADLVMADVSLGRLDEILAAPAEAEPGKALCPSLEGKVEFDHVDFCYEDGRPVLRDITFAVQPGQTVGILGSTGAGKSTLVHLLQRLYLPTGGRILLDGVDIRDIRADHLRSHVGIVLQEPFLFSRTIGENISLARPSATEEERFSAARTACIHDVITQFSEGYDTVVGERGVTLSGGQKQRVAIARMLVQNTPVCIFDDSLSAVDAETDASIRAALAARGTGTTFLISHRIATLRQADLILVLENGEIVQRGTHAQLCAQEGLYRRICVIQNELDDPQKGGVAVCTRRKTTTTAKST